MTRRGSWFIVLVAIGGGVAAGSAACRSSIALGMGVIAACGLGAIGIGAGPAPRSPLTRMHWRASRWAGPPMTAFGGVGALVALLSWLVVGSGSCR